MSCCTRCGMGLREPNAEHYCDGRLIDVAYEQLIGKDYGKPVSILTLASEAGVSADAVTAWVATKSDLVFKGFMIVLVESEQSDPDEDESGALTPIFLLTRVERLAQELGRREVQIALLQDQLEKANEEILKLRGQS